MSLDRDLLEQAHHLCTRERKRPRQASLRRAVSSAYYAIFHLLVREATEVLLLGDTMKSLRAQVGRAFKHGSMKETSKAVAAGKSLKGLQRTIASVDVRTVASTFVKLQEERHRADYDVGTRFTRSEVERLVQLTSRAFQLWQAVRKTPDANLFLVALAFQGQLPGT